MSGSSNIDRVRSCNEKYDSGFEGALLGGICSFADAQDEVKMNRGMLIEHDRDNRVLDKTHVRLDIPGAFETKKMWLADRDHAFKSRLFHACAASLTTKSPEMTIAQLKIKITKSTLCASQSTTGESVSYYTNIRH